MKGVRFNTFKGKYEAMVYDTGTKILLGTYLTEEEAIAAKMNYLARINSEIPDYELLAKNPGAWSRKSNDILHKLSQRKECVRVAE